MICTSDAMWENSPSTTNAIEAHNKASKLQATSVKGTLEHVYRCDRAIAYEVLAAESGITVASSQWPHHSGPITVGERQRKNQWKWRRKKVAVASAGSEVMLQITPEHRAQLADKSDQTRKKKETGTWTSTATKKTRMQTSDISDTHHLDTGMLGKRDG